MLLPRMFLSHPPPDLKPTKRDTGRYLDIPSAGVCLGSRLDVRLVSNEHIMDGYKFLMQDYNKRDKVYMFGCHENVIQSEIYAAFFSPVAATQLGRSWECCTR
jgi:Uncharacterized alpha/beta hydrolase domain (DUF2235)